MRREALAVHPTLFGQAATARLGRPGYELLIWLVAHYDCEEGVVVEVPTVAGELHRHPRTMATALDRVLTHGWLVADPSDPDRYWFDPDLVQPPEAVGLD